MVIEYRPGFPSVGPFMDAMAAHNNAVKDLHTLLSGGGDPSGEAADAIRKAIKHNWQKSNEEMERYILAALNSEDGKKAIGRYILDILETAAVSVKEE